MLCWQNEGRAGGAPLNGGSRVGDIHEKYLKTKQKNPVQTHYLLKTKQKTTTYITFKNEDFMITSTENKHLRPWSRTVSVCGSPCSCNTGTLGTSSTDRRQVNEGGLRPGAQEAELPMLGQAGGGQESLGRVSCHRAALATGGTRQAE